MNSLISEIKYRTKNKFKFLYSYVSSSILGPVYHKHFTHVKTFCLFIGYPRSGHTLVASILNAHPNISISIEYGLLLYIKLLRCRRNQIFYALTKNSKNYSEKKNNVWTGYSYNIPNSWQGKHKTLMVLGDKNGGANSMLLQDNPDLLNRLSKVIKIKPKIIHVIRNPFDIITTHSLRPFMKNDNLNSFQTTDLLLQIKKYFVRADVIMKLKIEGEYEIMDLYHEELISHPEKTLNDLIQFLGFQKDDEYLKICASIIYKKPHKSRFDIIWPKDLIQYVEKKFKDYPFLKHYSYNG